MQQIGIDSYLDYIDFLEVHPDEFDPLFNTVLINVTSFFRDPQAWQALSEQILPRILEAKAEDQPMRCWSAGCASGEEAYTLAMLLAEAVGEQQFRQRVKIYATDVDEEALAQARQGSYTADAVAALPAGMLAKYFEPAADRFVFRPDLRRSLIFGRHDLVQDAAISRLDLLVCRNTLMYFNSETQAKILARFHFALRPSGYLLLGKAETLLSHNTSFRPEDLKSRIFQRTSSATMRDRLLAMTPAAAPIDSQPGGDGAPGPRARGRLRQRPGGAARRRPQGASPAGQREGPPALQPRPDRPRPPAAGPRDLLPAGRAALAHRDGAPLADGRDAQGGRVAPGRRRAARAGHPGACR